MGETLREPAETCSTLKKDRKAPEKTRECGPPGLEGRSGGGGSVSRSSQSVFFAFE